MRSVRGEGQPQGAPRRAARRAVRACRRPARSAWSTARPSRRRRTKTAVALRRDVGARSARCVVVVADDEENLGQVVPQPRAGRRRRAVRARGRRRRLGALAARLRGGAGGARPRRPGRSAPARRSPSEPHRPPGPARAGRLREELQPDRGQRKYAFRVHPDAHKTQIRQAVEELFDVQVIGGQRLKVQPKPKRRGLHKGTKQGWKKAIVQVHAGEEIQIFAGAQV